MPEPAGTCDDAAASSTCLDALLQEVRRCTGVTDETPLVEGLASADHTTCTDDTDPERKVTFRPAVTEESRFGEFAITSGEDTCAIVTVLEDHEWGRQVATESGTYAIWMDDLVISFSCPDGTTADIDLKTHNECDQRVSVAEGFGSGTAAYYNWQGINWYRCTWP